MIRDSLTSKFLNREVLIDFVLPPNFKVDESNLKLLILNDGQDAESYQLKSVLHDLQNTNSISPTVAVAVHVGERKQEYGISERPDYSQRGSRAIQYQNFVANELFPWVKQRYSISPKTEDIAVAGFSLGALSAFDLAWHLPSFFGFAGLFSGSFWWRSKSLDNHYKPSDRIALQLVNETIGKKEIKLWFQTGWLDEYADRDSDGLIDSIGDTLDLIQELKIKGYKIGQEIEYLELGAGRHDHKTMAKAFPEFLKWWQKHSSHPL